jgi:excisionase family DNA binding protein
MTPASFSGKLYSLEHLSEQWNCSVRHIRRLIASGQLGAVKVGGLVRIPQAEVERFLADRFVAPVASIPYRWHRPTETGSMETIVDGILNRKPR